MYLETILDVPSSGLAHHRSFTEQVHEWTHPFISGWEVEKPRVQLPVLIASVPSPSFADGVQVDGVGSGLGTGVQGCFHGAFG